MDHHHGGADHGHEPGQASHEIDHTGHEEMFRRRFWVCLALSLPVLFWSDTIQGWLGYTAPEFTGSALIVPGLSTLIFVYGGLPFLQMARTELARRQPAMMTLISLAITVAFIFSLATVIWSDLGEDFFWELVTLIDVMLLGHWMEMRSVRVASGSLDSLARLVPDTAEVVGDDGRAHERYLDEVAEGEIVLVRPGHGVPTDGKVVEGTTQIDESMLTGESRPVPKEPGDSVIGGTVNTGNAAIRFKVTATGEDTALAGIMRLVAEAKASRSPTQLLADKAAAFLFYAALVAAAITAVVWTVIGVGVDEQVVARVVTVLVIACPHALGLAIPLVVANTTSIAAGQGTLIRNREAIDTAKDVDVVVFDKTGTLTEGSIGITGMTSIGITKSDALRLAAAAEADSEHVIARAFRREVEGEAGEVPPAEGAEILKGRGVVARVEGHEIHVGGPALLDALDVTLPGELQEFGAKFGQRGESVVYMLRDREPVAGFSLADVVRDESHQAVQSLHEMGVEVVMLTGDSEAVAAAVSERLGIDRYRAQVLPADKDGHIETLRREGKMVAMVGDGVNDAPALARADIGIAIGSGTDVAVESADLVLVKSNPMDIVRLIRLSVAAYRKQAQNIWWAAGYNIVMIPLAAGILAPWGFVMPPAVGAIVMSVSTIVVAVNAQLLRQVDLSR